MRNIEKSLTSYVKGTGAIIKDEALYAYAKKDVNEMINILFKIINEELDKTTGSTSLDRVIELFHRVQYLLKNYEGVDRKLVAHRLHKLDEKIDRIKGEKRNKFTDVDKAYEELEKVRAEVESVEIENETKETKQYDFINYLVDGLKNITYLEYTFSKMPSLVNVKDKDDISLFQNIIKRYVESVKKNEEEDCLYYSNLISLILSQKSFHMTDIEKRKILETIYSAIDRISINKKLAKKNQDKIEWLKELITSIKESGEKHVNVEGIAKKYNIEIAFHPSLLEELDLIKMPKEGEKTDRYLPQEYIITIDGAGAVEIDDALSCRRLKNGNYLLGVHIASVLGYASYESPLVEEAIARGKTIYLPTKYQLGEESSRVIVMFPQEFSASTASLLPGSPKFARSYYFEISPDGEIVDEKFMKSIIRNNCRMTYSEVDKVLKKGSKDPRLQETIQNLQQVTEVLDRQYKVSDLYEQVKESTEDISDLRVKRAGAEKIVYQAMLLTGNRVGKFFADPSRGYPCLYRVHEVNEEDTKKLQAMVNNLTKTYGGDQYQKLFQLINGLYPKGWYATSGGHAGLKLDHYCHCTSELRRAPDIVVEHALEVCYDKTPTDQELQKLEAEVEKRAAQINGKQNPIEWFVKDFQRAYQKRR